MSWGHHILGVPIIMYHKIGVESDPELMTIAPSEFEADLFYLKDQGFQAISLNQLTDYIKQDGGLPPRPVLISFDDGYRSQYEIAFPLLEQYGFQANFNVIVKWVGRDWTMSWEELKEMQLAGVADIQSHTYDQHRLVPDTMGGEGYAVTTRIRDASNSQVESYHTYYRRLYNDFLLAKETIQESLGHSCDFLCYPYHQCNEIARAAAREAGYRGQIWGEGLNRRGDDVTMIKRIPRYPGQPLERSMLVAPLQEFRRTVRKLIMRSILPDRKELETKSASFLGQR